MTKLKSGIIFMFVLIKQSTQFSISSEVDSELPSLSSSASSSSSSSFSPLETASTSSSSSSSLSNQTGCNFKTIGQCFRLRPNELGTCAIEHAINNMDCLIVSNETWHLNEFITVKKNDDWPPPPQKTEIESRQEQTPFAMALSKFNDLVSSRSIQFSLPRIFDLLPEGRVKSGFDYAGLSGFAGRKKKKHGMMGMITIIAMMAQLFLGKLAFLAGAALLLSKVSLFFSIVSALKKHGTIAGGGGVGGGSDHLVHGGIYPDIGYQGGYHNGYQRSIKPMPPNWMVNEPPTTAVTSIPV